MTMTERTVLAADPDWWRGAVIYQIYPRSFQDSNGDGVGDLNGITARLPHIAGLGADAIWISPFFTSPMKDFGYDVSDYCDVDPLFGSLQDFDALVARATEVGLKVMIDLVLSHTAAEHPWFKESRKSRVNDKSDWYVWAEPKGDGTPPNNWLSIFGGSAWQWDARREQYYLHNFLTSQPDLNFHNPQVQAALLETVKFWLELGVDGYRLDTANFYFHDAQLTNNPPRGRPSGEDRSVTPVNPYAWQWHKYDKSQPENLPFLRRLRALIDQYPNTTMVGEIGDDDGLARVAEYTGGGDKLHMAYCFELLGPEHSAEYLHAVLSRFEEVCSGGWPCWALTNHDMVRVATRWGGDQANPALLRLAAALQMSMRGSPCIYQGDELGLPEAEVAFEDMKDPYGIAMWPEYKGRDGCRTPMPWVSGAKDLGFSPASPTTNAPWLPVSESHRALAADAQEVNPSSLLHFYRCLLQWRRTQPALVDGGMLVIPSDEQVLAYIRACPTQRILCVFNFSGNAASWTIPEGHIVSGVLNDSGLSGAHLDSKKIELAPWSGLFALLE